MRRPSDIQMPKFFRGALGWFALGLVILGTLTGLVTFLVLTGLTPIKPSEEIISGLLFANTALVILMAVLIAVQVVQLLIAHRKGTPGAGLHIRLISLFSIVAVAPALLVAMFAALTLNRGLDAWFSDRTRNIVDTASTVAEAYLLNASDATRNDLASISTDINQQRAMYDSDRAAFVQRVARHALVRNLAAAFVFDASSKRIDANFSSNERLKFVAPTEEALAKAEKGELVLIPPSPGGNVVRALIKLQGYPSHYLYIYRVLSPVVIEQLVKTREAKAEYDQLMKQRLGVQLTFGLTYALVALALLLAAIWAGLRFSERLVEPLVRLLRAARRVAEGDFNAKVATPNGPGDLINLSQTFNMMTDQVRLHQNQLVKTNQQLDERRRFTEAMLAGVSAGVLGIDPQNVISIVNRSAATLLGVSEKTLLGSHLADAIPEFVPLLELALSRPSGIAEGQVEMNVNGRVTNVFLRITTEAATDADHGYVLTFDDITSLVSAQRNSAWADIARRIAHEIKNPLTPIQLSAERLKRKYLKEITTDKHVFEQCTDTIIRQVGDLGRIVDEFSSFARMPKAVPEPNNLNDVVRDATVLQRVATEDITIELELDSSLGPFAFDRRLVTQAITNLVKNARESIETRISNDTEPAGKIYVTTGIANDAPFIRVQDNGIGLPQEQRHRLAEPYMTTREKGTGLGLAIVKRIMEEHGGTLDLRDAESGQGAIVTLNFAEQSNAGSFDTKGQVNHGR
jgi:two-component system, NtrC family, nitrogen regulation sensor histidine kinase NtrY